MFTCNSTKLTSVPIIAYNSNVHFARNDPFSHLRSHMVNGPEAARLHSLLSATMQTGRSLESSQIQDCSSGKLSKAFHTSAATVTAVRREVCFRKAKNHNNYYECEQTGFRWSTALFSSAHSRLTSKISPWCATFVWSTHGLVSAFLHVGRQFGTSRPNTLACGLRKRPWSFLMGVTIVTPNRIYVCARACGEFANQTSHYGRWACHVIFRPP